MKKIIDVVAGCLAGLAIGCLAVLGSACQTESLSITRSFPFSILMDAFPTGIPRKQPTSIGFGIKTDYITAQSNYWLRWQVVAPHSGVLSLNHRVITEGVKSTVSPITSAFLTDTLTYMPADSGQHLLNIQIVDQLGQKKDTTITLSVY